MSLASISTGPDLSADQFGGALNLNGADVTVFWKTSSLRPFTGWWFEWTFDDARRCRGPFNTSREAYLSAIVDTWNLLT